MTRIGPYDNGDNSHRYDGVLPFRGQVQTLEIPCFTEVRRLVKKQFVYHGGSRNVAIRDGQIAVLGDQHLKLLDAVTLQETAQFSTVVRNGCPGWYQYTTSDKPMEQRRLQGHSVPCGLSVIYWHENGWIAVTPGGDIGQTATGRDFVRVSGEGPVPTVPRGSNQREYLGICDRNPIVLCGIGGFAAGRVNQGIIGGAIKCPTLMDNPTYLSTPDCHYVFAPASAPPGRGGQFQWSRGIQISRIASDRSVTCVFLDNAINVKPADPAQYQPQPWCLVNGTIYLWSATQEFVLVDTATWDVTYRKPMVVPVLFPRLAVNQSGVSVLLSGNFLHRVGGWKVPCPMDPQQGRTNKQFSNHLAIDDSWAYVCRLLAGKLTITRHSLATGAANGSVVVPIADADSSGQCVDFCLHDGAAYALLTPREPVLDTSRKFKQILVRVS